MCVVIILMLRQTEQLKDSVRGPAALWFDRLTMTAWRRCQYPYLPMCFWLGI